MARFLDGGCILEVKTMADFIINQRPYSISLDCPYCDRELEFSWDDINPPDYWGDKWNDVECPYCHKRIQLDEYEID